MNIADLCDPGSEALPDPREAAELALREVPWLREPDCVAILAALDAAGLIICWQP